MSLTWYPKKILPDVSPTAQPSEGGYQATDTPFPFGFLQKAQGPLSNTAAPRTDYCLRLGTTQNQKGRCLNLRTPQEVIGDILRIAPLTQDAISKLESLAQPATVITPPSPIPNPNAPYSLNPNRGVDDEVQPVHGAEIQKIELVPAEEPLNLFIFDILSKSFSKSF